MAAHSTLLAQAKDLAAGCDAGCAFRFDKALAGVECLASLSDAASNIATWLREEGEDYALDRSRRENDAHAFECFDDADEFEAIAVQAGIAADREKARRVPAGHRTAAEREMGRAAA